MVCNTANPYLSVDIVAPGLIFSMNPYMCSILSGYFALSVVARDRCSWCVFFTVYCFVAGVVVVFVTTPADSFDSIDAVVFVKGVWAPLLAPQRPC